MCVEKSLSAGFACVNGRQYIKKHRNLHACTHTLTNFTAVIHGHPTMTCLTPTPLIITIASLQLKFLHFLSPASNSKIQNVTSLTSLWPYVSFNTMNKSSWCFSMSCEFALGQSTVISTGQVCVFSPSFGSFKSFYLSVVGVKARWRQSLQGADGSRQKAQGLLSDREPLSSAYLKFSLCLITNHSPDSTQAKRRKAGPPQPSSLLIPAPLSFSPLPLSLSLQPCDSGRRAGL